MAGYGFGAKVKLTVDRSSKAEFNNQIQAMVGQIKISNKFTVLQKDMDRVRKETQAMLNSKPLTLKVNKIDCSAAVKDVKKQLQTMLSALSVSNGVNITGLKDFVGVDGIDESLRQTADSADTAIQKLNETRDAAAKVAGQMEALSTKIQQMKSVYKSALSGKSMIADDAQMRELTAQFDAVIQKYESLRALGNQASQEEITNVQNECAELQRKITVLQQAQSERERAATSAEKAAERATAATARETEADKKKAAAAEAANKAWESTGRDAAIKRTNNLLNDLTKKHNTWTAAAVGGTKQYYEALGICVKKLSDLKTDLADNTITQEKYNKEFGKISLAAGEAALNIVQAGKNVEGLGSRLGNLSSKFASWLSVSQIIMYAVRSVRQMVTTVVELDSAMTQLQIVTGASDIKMREFLQEATVLAKELGRSITEILSSIETFSRLGYNLEDASELAKYANIMANVASVDTSEATTGLTSIIKGFNLDVSEAEHVADVLVEVGQKYAVSAAEMIEAYEKSGAALNATNTSFEKSAGLIAAANAAVQNASTVGKYCAQCHSNVA